VLGLADVVKTAASVLVLWTVGGLLAHSTAGSFLALWGVGPDLLSLVVIYWALAFGARAGVIAGFVVGLVADAQAARFFGLSAGTLAAIGFVVGTLGGSLHRERPPAQLVVLFLGTVAALSVRFLFSTFGDMRAWITIFPRDVVLRALYTAVLGPVLYTVMRALGAPNFLAHATTAAQPRS
jgi:rod shape-determining protein MreD